MKFSSDPHSISKDEADDVRNKIFAFKESTGTRNACHVTYVTTYGVAPGKNTAIVQSQVTLDDLFKE